MACGEEVGARDVVARAADAVDRGLRALGASIAITKAGLTTAQLQALFILADRADLFGR